MRIPSFVLVFVAAVSVAACGGDITPVPAPDGGGADAATLCTLDVDCNDALFCNGAETCARASTMADERGCAPGDPPCAATETCDETANTCALKCEDLDDDGHGAASCGGNDCDDSNAAIHPGLPDGPPTSCNGLDDDCSGASDEGCPCIDGEERPCYGGPAGTRGVGACTDGVALCISGMLMETCLGDVIPTTEFCDGLDNDCDGTTDNGVAGTFYIDVDGDGFGTETDSVTACVPPAGYSSSAGDCDDTLSSVNPASPDLCDGLDNDCDGMTDEGVTTPFYFDYDGDGFGNVFAIVYACVAPANHAATSTDCDDARSDVHPGAVEVCNLRDDDCDGITDEAVCP